MKDIRWFWKFNRKNSVFFILIWYVSCKLNKILWVKSQKSWTQNGLNVKWVKRKIGLHDLHKYPNFYYFSLPSLHNSVLNVYPVLNELFFSNRGYNNRVRFYQKLILAAFWFIIIFFYLVKYFLSRIKRLIGVLWKSIV